MFKGTNAAGDLFGKLRRHGGKKSEPTLFGLNASWHNNVHE